MKKVLLAFAAATVILAGMMFFVSCSHKDNTDSPLVHADVPRVILDADIGSSTDDLFVLEMLYRYEEQGRCQLLGVVVDREGEQNAAFTDQCSRLWRATHSSRYPHAAP